MTRYPSHRHSPRLRAPLRTSMLVARVLEGFREPASALAEMLAPVPHAALTPVPLKTRRETAVPPR